MRYAISAFLKVRYWIRPDVRAWLDGFGALFAITLFFCLIQSAHDGIANRNRDFDAQRWWFPIYKILMM
ncbi:hypothetical protein CQ13_26945 [Bradyrhizobium retamae]|uniref:ABC transporter permease n=1 Tax=Bradyrhizobium retamae TaxID=1300035 RepID=A0A0R3N0E9_9BRAD|nr:hypothetical protein CQ13_26945 [Bradyrhizobium retamae]